LKLDYSAMRKLNEEGPRLPKTAKEGDDLLSATRTTCKRLTNLPEGSGAPENRECLGTIVVHGVGELGREVANVGLGDRALNSVGKELARRWRIVRATHWDGIASHDDARIPSN
jgi:hypothetical protein